MSTRIQYIDLAKGICISIVMLFHIRGIANHDSFFGYFLFGPCMLPPFFFIAGVFINADMSFKRFFLSKANTLLIPFAFFYLTTSVMIPNVLHYALGMHFNTVVGWPSLWAFVWPGEFPNIPLWFLWCLFIMEIIFFGTIHLHRCLHSKYSKYTLLLICFSLSTVGYGANRYLSADIACLLKAFENLPFLCTGYLARYFVTHLQTELKGIQLRTLLIVSFSVTLISMIPCVHQNPVAEMVAFYLCGIAGSYFVVTLSALVNTLPLLTFLGRHSIIVVLTHGLMIRAGYNFFSKLSLHIGGYGSITLFWGIMGLSYFAIVPILRHTMPRMIGQVKKKRYQGNGSGDLL